MEAVPPVEGLAIGGNLVGQGEAGVANRRSKIKATC